MALRVKKPHDKALRRLMSKEYVDVHERSTGLYFSKLKKQTDIFGVRPIRSNTFMVYKRNDFELDMDGRKFTWFRKKKAKY